MSRTLFAVGLAALAAPAMAADPATIDWTKVPASAVTLFYPGQSSYEWPLAVHDARRSCRRRAAG